MAAIVSGLWQRVTTAINDHPTAASILLRTTVGAIAVPIAAPALISAAGFSAIGPVAGSLAAAWQASIGNVAAGSAFAVLQSAAMGGAGAGIVTALTAVGGAAVGLVSGTSAYLVASAIEDTENEDRDHDISSTENDEDSVDNTEDDADEHDE